MGIGVISVLESELWLGYGVRVTVSFRVKGWIMVIVLPTRH